MPYRKMLGPKVSSHSWSTNMVDRSRPGRPSVTSSQTGASLPTCSRCFATMVELGTTGRMVCARLPCTHSKRPAATLQNYIQEIEQDEQAVSGMAKVAAAQAKARTGSD